MGVFTELLEARSGPRTAPPADPFCPVNRITPDAGWPGERLKRMNWVVHPPESTKVERTSRMRWEPRFHPLAESS